MPEEAEYYPNNRKRLTFGQRVAIVAATGVSALTTIGYIENSYSAYSAELATLPLIGSGALIMYVLRNRPDDGRKRAGAEDPQPPDEPPGGMDVEYDSAFLEEIEDYMHQQDLVDA